MSDTMVRGTSTGHDLPYWAWRLFRKKRFKVPHGGRGSGKSTTVARVLLMFAHQPELFTGGERRALRILCTREFQNSIRESVHKLLSTQIDKMKLTKHFTVEKTSIRHNETGSEFIFAGLAKNIDNIKSMEDIDIAWVEEAHNVSNNSWEVLIPTIRKDGSEIWVTFNPNEEDDPTYERFVVQAAEDREHIDSFVVNWIHNPWFPETLKIEKARLERIDPEAAEHVYGGKTNTRSNAVVFRGKYVVHEFTPVTDDPHEENNWLGPYYGADWGFAQDPCVLMKLWISPTAEEDKRLYIEKESWGIGVENDDIAPNWKIDIPECVDGVIRADNSRPETISHVANKGGLNVIAAEKWPGSVEDGISFMKSFVEIVVHPQCEHQAEEFRLYKYVVDPITGDVKKKLVDKHNHCTDADRYALEPAIGEHGSIYNAL